MTLRTIQRMGILGLTMCGLIIAGCASANGTWKFQDIAPSTAEKSFEWRTIKLIDNGNFEATVIRGGKSVELKGTWTFDEPRKALDLRDTEGASHAFNAELIESGKAMLIWNVGTKKEWTARFNRA